MRLRPAPRRRSTYGQYGSLNGRGIRPSGPQLAKRRRHRLHVELPKIKAAA